MSLSTNSNTINTQTSSLMSVSTNSTTINAIDTQTSSPMSVKQVRDKFTSKAIEVIREITQDNEQRMQTYPSDQSVLNSGIYYPNEYYKALKAMKQEERIKHFVEKGSFVHGFASKHFSRLKDPKALTGFDTALVLNEGEKPSEALKAMRTGIRLIGCGEAVQIAYYEGIQEILGTEKFDMLFAADSSTPLKLKLNTFHNPSYAFNKLVTVQSNPKKCVQGQIYFFTNVPGYGTKHYLGEATGYNTICVSDTPSKVKFTTLGLSSKGVTKEEIRQKLLNEFNSEPMGTEILTAEIAQSIIDENDPRTLAIRDSFKDFKYTMKDFTKVGGGKMPVSVAPKIELITQLANSSLKKARKIFDAAEVN